MSVLLVTVLAGLGAIGASAFVLTSENKDIAERKKDELYLLSKEPYDFSMNKAGLERLVSLKGELFMQALRDPRFDADKVLKLKKEQLLELARSAEDVPNLLKTANEYKMRALIDAWDRNEIGAEQMSGQVFAWVLMLSPKPAESKGLDKLAATKCTYAARVLMALIGDQAFRFRGEAKRALGGLVTARSADVGHEIASNDLFLRSDADLQMIARIAKFLQGKTQTQFVNMAGLRDLQWVGVAELWDACKDNKTETSKLIAYMHDYYLPRYASIMSRSFLNGVAATEVSGKYIVKFNVGKSKTTAEDTIVRTVPGSSIDTTNTATFDDKPKNVTITVARAFDYEETLSVNVA